MPDTSLQQIHLAPPASATDSLPSTSRHLRLDRLADSGIDTYPFWHWFAQKVFDKAAIAGFHPGNTDPGKQSVLFPLPFPQCFSNRHSSDPTR